MFVQRPAVTLAPNERLPTTRNLQQHLSPPFQPPLTNAFSLTLGRIRFTAPFEALVYRSCALLISARTNCVSCVFAPLDFAEGVGVGVLRLGRGAYTNSEAVWILHPPVVTIRTRVVGVRFIDLRLFGADILCRGTGFFLFLFTGADESNTEDD